MGLITVEATVQSATIILQDSDGAHWGNSELVGYLNEAYRALVVFKPDASSINETVSLVAGIKQELPTGGVRLLDVVRNISGDPLSIHRKTQNEMDALDPEWMAVAESGTIENYIFKEEDPKAYYVYPPAVNGTTIEIIYAVVPGSHDGNFETSKTDTIKLDDIYQPALVDYILYRAFSKDADHVANAERSRAHYQAFTNLLGVKAKIDSQSGPKR